jgi:hypothetical protein
MAQIINHVTSKSIEQLLEEWKVYCKQNSVMHNSSRGYFKALNYGLMIPSIILSSTAGVSTIGSPPVS